jgi:hypothetical protein
MFQIKTLLNFSYLPDPNRSGELTVMPVALSTTIGGCRG